MGTDVVVVGAGVIGSAIALELSRAGRDVTVVDKAGGVGLGSTSASSAVIRFNFSTYAGVAASWEAAALWTHWPEHLGHDVGELARFERSGLVMLDADVAPRSLYLPLFDEIGIQYDEWDSADLRAHVAGIDAGRYWPPRRLDDEAFWKDAVGTLGGVWTPDAGYVTDPQLAAQNLADAARLHGAQFSLRRAVTGVDVRHGRVAAVMMDDGTRIACSTVVNAAGPWSGKVNELAGVGGDFTIGTRPMRQEVAYVSAPEGFAGPGGVGISIADMDLGTYMRGASGGGLLVGGTEPECDPVEWIDDPDAASPAPTAAVFEAHVTRAARRLTDLTVPHRAKGVAGVYDVADDWTPIYDRTDLDGFYVAMGTSGNQFKNAPLVGLLMRTLIEEVEGGADHDLVPVRYAAGRTGTTIDLGAFSRRRSVNAASSGTVMG
ncbi:FAD-binding oxidoreductase [Streptomyces sp. SID14478]|uniref:NAD(P)/FAD-dependent oxidoreductase n=1 Tax=Streptomyces sp. SID14478 TaxID=2706073 RepID=UPI0013D99FC3|nr:FAD-dependent oxidoreductase [Streptomyces sp. SID14478]NEB75562.1 FAD-binding oxidoreductase [Streptomyces sp. SID14478]